MEVDVSLYTDSQVEKIKQLRKEADLERRSKKIWLQYLKEIDNHSTGLKSGDSVYVTFDNKTISGYILSIKNDIYECSTPLGKISVTADKIRKREVIDYSNVEIPEILKTIPTRELLTWRRWSATNYCGEGYLPCPVTFEQLKAELSLRSHIKTKKELKKFNKFKKKK